mmetsp:Transcript_31617/g.57503  ORF Transcript_31617/g.57503 Transcript_31617/m.57503 type:complete len:285 (-) Transcript_31617:2324-3178(-)
MKPLTTSAEVPLLFDTFPMYRDGASFTGSVPCHKLDISSALSPRVAMPASAARIVELSRLAPKTASKRCLASAATSIDIGKPSANFASCKYCLSKSFFSEMSFVDMVPFFTTAILLVVRYDWTNLSVSLFSVEGLMMTTAWFNMLLSISFISTSCTFSQTFSTSCLESIRRMIPSRPNLSATGMDSFSKVLKRFLMDSKLSSARPLVFPRSRSLASITSSGQSKKRQHFTSTLLPRISSQPFKLSKLLGKPSMRYLPSSQPRTSMACWRSCTVISTGTSFPSLM